jgi:hypothetical protein
MTFTQGATKNSGAAFGFTDDDHSMVNPSLLVRRPLVVGSVIADQVYEYSADGQTWYPIPGADYEIEKGVRMAGNQFRFVFRKQSAPVSTDRFHLEVEYPIGPPVANPLGKIAVGQAFVAPIANIAAYASRVIRLG